MIRRPRSLLRHPIILTCQALVAVAVVGVGAGEPASPPANEPAPPTTTEPAPRAEADEKAALASPHASEPGKTDTHLASASLPAAAKPAVKYPAEIQGLLNLGGSLTDRGDYESAEIAFRQVLNAPEVSVPDLQNALLGLARMHRRQGALTKAVAIYEKFLKDYPGGERSPDVLLSLGRTHRDMGAYKLAISRFYNVINSTLKLPGEGFEHYQLLAKTAQFEIAETHFQAGDFAEASKFFSRLRLLDLAAADRANAHFKAAYALQLQGDLEGALTSLRTFLEQWPDNENVPEARYLYAITLRALNRREEAFAVTLELLQSEKLQMAANPKRWAYWQRRTGNQLANDFFEHGETFNAQAIYDSLIVLSEELSWRLPTTYQIALCQERLGSPESARASYQKIVDAAGTNPAPELAEVARMAAWRIGQLEWREQVGRQVTAFFDTSTGRTPPVKLKPTTSALP